MWKEFTKGIFKKNAVFVLMLGLCPLLAVTNKAINGLAMGVATTFVLVSSSTMVSIFKNYIPGKIRIPAFIIVIASFVTITKLVMQAYTLDLYNAMGIFISLIVVNCLILGRAEAFASKNSVPKAILDALGMGIGFTLSLTILSIIREALGAGMLTFSLQLGQETVGADVDLAPVFRAIGMTSGDSAQGNEQIAKILVFILPAGGFLTIGILMGLYNHFYKNKIKDEE
jgi:Na+-translocating ferredoxin:NAD+ oxidoreductase subunit E